MSKKKCAKCEKQLKRHMEFVYSMYCGLWSSQSSDYTYNNTVTYAGLILKTH